MNIRIEIDWLSDPRIKYLPEIINSKHSKGRIHLSNKKITKVKNEKEMSYLDFKPNGLWYGLNDTWKDFLIKSSKHALWTTERLLNCKYIYDVVLNKNANILKLKSYKDIVKFTIKYGHKLSAGFLIYWDEVQEKYDGIEVKMQKKSDKYTYWTENWDCDSGCVWNKRAVKKIKLIKKIGN